MNVGYSKRTLVEKLGIKDDFKVAIINSPKDYEQTLGRLPQNVITADALDNSFNFVQFFTKWRRELETEFSTLKGLLEKDGILWISWPKGSSKVETDLSENVVREIGLKHGLVDVKVIAVDEIWSGLKFVYRSKDRR